MRILQHAMSLTSGGPVGVFGLRADALTPPPRPGIELWSSSSDASLTDPAVASSLDWLRQPGGVPWDQYFSTDALAELDAVIDRFRPDVVVVESLNLYRYVEPLAGRDFSVVLDVNNVYSAFYRELAERSAGAAAVVRRELASRAEGVERRTIELADQIWVCSDIDAELVQTHRDTESIVVVPNTIDVESYVFAPQSRARPTMTFPAMFAYPPNEAAALFLALEVVPKLAGRFEDLELVLVGRNPTAAMLETASDDARVVVTGAVPDVRPYLADAGAVPIPLFDGSGTRLKALEAFAAGVPVVSTAKGLEGLDVVPDVHYLRAEDADEFVDALTCLWSDPESATRLAGEARALVVAQYSWETARSCTTEALARLGA
jgi:glycosyltransferase involved in cell wall biosynthesis